MPGRDIQISKVATFIVGLPKQRRIRRKKMFLELMKKIFLNYRWERGSKGAE